MQSSFVGISESTLALDAVKSDYHAAVDAWNVLRGEDLHPDVELLKHVELDQGEFTALLERHLHTPTMIKVLRNYQDCCNLQGGHSLVAGIVVPTAETKKKNFDGVHKLIIGAVLVGPIGYNSQLMFKDDVWDAHMEEHGDTLALPEPK